MKKLMTGLRLLQSELREQAPLHAKEPIVRFSGVSTSNEVFRESVGQSFCLHRVFNKPASNHLARTRFLLGKTQNKKRKKVELGDSFK